MGERAKVILNEYSAKSLLMRDTLNLDKFYTTDLKMFIEVARKEINRLNNIINEIEKDLEDRYYGRGKYSLSTDIVGIPTFLNRIKELKGEDKK